MLTIAIGFIAFVVISAAAGNGEWGSVAVGAVIVLVLMLASHVEREETRAWSNRVRYWAEGGPEREGKR